MATVTCTIPQDLFRVPAAIEKAAADAVNATTAEIYKDFQSSTQHFNHKPAFARDRASVQGSEVIGRVWTDDENYARLNDGTNAHVVGGSGQFMRFYGVRRRNYQRGIMVYQPKSIAGEIASRPGGPLTNYKAGARGPWRVKGIEPRNYDVLIADKNQSILEAALARALQAIK